MLILTALLVLLTAVYAWLTYRILHANRSAVAASRDAVFAMREQTVALYRPYVTVTTFAGPEDQTGTLYLRVTNTGQSAAENMELQLDRSFHVGREQPGGFDLAQAGAFTRPIQTFAPRSELTFLLGSHGDIFGKNGRQQDPLTPWEFNISARYSFLGKPIAEEITAVDLRYYELSIPPHDASVRELQRIRRAVSRLHLEVQRLTTELRRTRTSKARSSDES